MPFPQSVDDEITLHLLEKKHAVAFLDLVDKDRDYLRATSPWVDNRTTIEDVLEYFDRIGKRYEASHILLIEQLHCLRILTK